MGAAEDVRERLASQPSMGDMQAAFRRIYPPVITVQISQDELLAALTAIKDGHNDPRALAADVLSKLSR
jgi:uncharacterized protein (DUF342 family)